MKDPDATSRPAEPADALVEGLEPGQPLADSVERHLAEAGGPVPVDESALQRAVASASARISARAEPRRSRAWVVAIVAAVLLTAVAFVALRQPEPEPIDLGPGISVEGEPTLLARARTLAVDNGRLRFERSESIRPRFDRIRIEIFDTELVPIGTLFEVEVEASRARLQVYEGSVRVEIRGTPRAEIAAGSSAVIDFNGVTRETVAAVRAVETESVTTPPSPVPPAVPGIEVAHVEVESQQPLPAILVLLAAADHDDLTLEEVRAALSAADAIGSARPLVPIADQLDPEQVGPHLAPLAWYVRARALQSRGQLGEALEAHKKVEGGHWIRPHAALAMGAVLTQLGELDGAKKHLRAAVEMGGRTRVAAHLALARAHLADGEPDRAIWTWRRAGIRSAPYDAMRVKSQRLSVRRHQATWRPELHAIERLALADNPYETALLDPTGAPPLTRQHLGTTPDLLELAAERRALDDLGDTLKRTHDPETTRALQRALDAHRAAADDATRRALSDLAAEIRRALP